MRSSIDPGDTILFKRGDTFEGPFSWTRSGAAGRPITFGNYGTGSLPLFVLPLGSTVELEERNLFYFGNVSYVTVDGFRITDLHIAADPEQLADHNMFAYVGTAIRFEGYDETDWAHDIVVKNCDISLTGMGVVWLGIARSSMTNNRITNLKNLRSTPGGDDDYGANGLTLLGDDNMITRNYFEGNWATSLDFVYNGGVFELYGGVNRNQFLYNVAIDCGSIAEFGSPDGATMADNVFAYNLGIDNGGVSWINLSGTFASDVSNVMFYNNTFVELNNRFGDSTFLFGYQGTAEVDTMFDFKNNLFYSRDFNMISGAVDASKVTHENNVYILMGGETRYSLHSSERSITAAPFVSMTSDDMLMWDYHLLPGSVGLGAGQSLGFTRDLLGTAVSGAPDVGAFQHE
ncbi:MAG: hypothetical protein IPK60_09255 [Sandaracinaceae bacterium]|nr:hypothetical protein [Sandaracinaceae bacterium]